MCATRFSKLAFALLVMAVAALAFSGCSPDRYGSKVYAVDELVDERLVGSRLAVNAFVKRGDVSCSSSICSSDPCCKECTAPVFLADKETGAQLRIRTDKFCRGTNCGLICEMEDNQSYVVKGLVTTNHLGQYVFIVEQP